MTRTFSHPLWKREVTVDDDGISERRAGSLVVFVPWDQVERLGTGRVRSDSGATISLRLSPNCRREFFRYASDVWQQRHPGRWQHNQERIRRDANRAAYVWFPLFILGPCVACYLLFWLLGWPESLRQELQKLHRLTIMGVIFVAVFLIWYVYRTRKAA